MGTLLLLSLGLSEIDIVKLMQWNKYSMNLYEQREREKQRNAVQSGLAQLHANFRVQVEAQLCLCSMLYVKSPYHGKFNFPHFYETRVWYSLQT